MKQVYGPKLLERKRCDTMAYSRPEIAALGDAARIIEELGMKPSGSIIEEGTGTWNLNPAYDLDEP